MTILRPKKPSCHSSKEIGNQIVRSDHAKQWKDFFCLKIDLQKDKKDKKTKSGKDEKKKRKKEKMKNGLLFSELLNRQVHS